MTRCSCIVAAVREMEYERAGVAPFYRDVEMSDLLKGGMLSRKNAERLVVPPYVTVLLHAPVDDARRHASVAWILRRAVDSKKTAKMITLVSSIEAQFDRDARSAWLGDLQTLDVLIFEMEISTEHKMVPQVVGAVWATRAQSRGLTVWVSSDHPGQAQGKYKPETARIFSSPSVAVISSRNQGSPA